MGIDYGMGLANIDNATGIRYGVIHHGEVGQTWYDESEPEYGEPCCGRCGGNAKPITNGAPIGDKWERKPHECEEFFCCTCKLVFGSESAYGEEPIGFSFVDDEYRCFQNGSDCDIFVELSPFYAKAPFCSPCAPGAGYLTGKGEDCKAYCFGPDWFEDGVAPYSVYRVSDDSLVYLCEDDENMAEELKDKADRRKGEDNAAASEKL